MKKLIALVIVALVAVGLVAPYVSGLAAEKAFRKMVDQLGREMGVAIGVSYQRGWFSSTAETTMDLGAALRNQLPPKVAKGARNLGQMKVTSVHHISHGPLPLANAKPGTSVPMPALARVRDVHTVELPAAVGTSLVVTTYTAINFDTSVDTSVDTAPFRKVMDDGTAIDVQRVSGTISMPPGLKSTSCSFTWPGMTIAGGCGNATLADMTFQCTQKKGVSGLRTGSVNLGIASCKAVATDDNPVQVEGFALKGESGESGELINGHATMSFAKAVIKTNLFGPGSATVVVENMHAQTLAALRDAMKELQKDYESPLAKFAFMTKAASLVTELLAHAPRIELKDCSLATADGTVTASALIKTASTKTGEVRLNDLFGLLDIEAALTVPEPMMARRLEQDKNADAMFVKKDGAYELRLTVRNGKTKINGERFNPMGLLMGGGRGGDPASSR